VELCSCNHIGSRNTRYRKSVRLYFTATLPSVRPFSEFDVENFVKTIFFEFLCGYKWHLGTVDGLRDAQSVTFTFVAYCIRIQAVWAQKSGS
jgi:hypothetical protein